MAHVAGHQPQTVEAQLLSQVSPRNTCGQSDNGTGFSQSTSVSPLSTSHYQHPTLIPMYMLLLQERNG